MSNNESFSGRVFAAIASVTISAVFLAIAIIPASPNVAIPGILA